MVLVSHRYKFLYIKLQKVAGTSVESFFGQFCCDPSVPYRFTHTCDESVTEFGILGSRMGGFAKDWLPHISAHDICTRLGKNVFDSYFKFCVVRNPWDKVVSFYCWQFKDAKQTKEGFTRFVKQFQNRDWKLHTIRDVCVCDFYIRYEHLTHDIQTVCERLHLDTYSLTDLPTFKTGTRRLNNHYSEYYTEETREIVRQKFLREIELFGYRFEEPKPNETITMVT